MFQLRSTSTQVQIRSATLDDAAAISEVLLRGFEAFRSQYTAAAWAATVPDALGVRGRLAEGPGWVATVRDTKGETIVGTTAALERPPGVYLRGMAVVPGARSRGIGAGLVSAVERWAVARGHRVLWLSTTPFLAGAIRLYERAGFVTRAVGPDDLHGVPLRGMARSLAGEPLP